MASSRANHSSRLVSYMLGARIGESVAAVSLHVPKRKVNLFVLSIEEQLG